jgi:hypothetical protein
MFPMMELFGAAMKTIHFNFLPIAFTILDALPNEPMDVIKPLVGAIVPKDGLVPNATNFNINIAPEIVLMKRMQS